MVNIAVLVSGGGTNLQAILDAQARGDIHNGRVSVVVSSNDKAYALERAKQAGVPSVVRRKKDYASGAEYCRALAQFLQEQDFPEKLILNVDIDRVKQFIAKGV